MKKSLKTAEKSARTVEEVKTMYINDYGEREADWYEVKRFLKGSNGNDDGRKERN